MIIRKFINFFAFGIILIFGIETLAAFYLNSFYIKDSGSYSMVRVSNVDAKKASLKKASIDSGAAKFSVSYDGNYLSYLLDGSLVIVDISSGKKTTVHNADNMKISDFKWIYDRNRMIITEIATGGNSYYGKMYYFDMKDKKLVEIRDNYNNRDVKITLNGNSDNISDLDMSAETNLTFLKVTYSSGNSRLWESNIMVSTNSLKNAVTKKIGRISCLKMTETLFYEDSDSCKVYRYGSSAPIDISGHTKFKLLGVDQNDNVYLASMNGSTADCIYYGNPLQKNWNKINTVGSVYSTRLCVTYQGAVYQDDHSNSKLINLKTKKVTKYSGSVIGIYDNGFLSRNNNQVKQNILN